MLAALALAGAAQSAGDPCAIEGVARVVAVGDVHGAHSQFLAILKTAGIVDAKGRWAGGRAHFVQTGDVLDRGGDSRKSLDLLKRLESEAARAGGRVHVLLGNHEAMRMLGDIRYVSAGEFAAFKTDKSQEYWERAYSVTRDDAVRRAKAAGETFSEAAYRAQFEKEIPLGLLEMREAFGPQGDYGKWLRARRTTVRIDGVQFVHGGISPPVAPLGCAAINTTVQNDLTVNFEQTRARPLESLAAREDGPLWYRGLAQQPEDVFAPEVDRIVGQLGVRAIVIGHTVTPDAAIRPRFNGRVLQIDTGMLDGNFFPGGRPSALEIAGSAMTAIYTDRREPIGQLTAAPAPR